MTRRTHDNSVAHHGLVPSAQLGSGGAGIGTKVLYDDQTFKTPSGTGGGVGIVTDGVTTVNPAVEVDFVGATVADLGSGIAEVTISSAGQFDDDIPALRFKTGYNRIAEIDPGTGFDAYADFHGNTITMIAGNGTDGGEIDIVGTAGVSAVVITVSDNSGADIGTIDVEPTSITLFTGGKILTYGKGIVFPSLAADPAAPTAGQTYFHTGSSKLRCWDGSAWNNLW